MLEEQSSPITRPKRNECGLSSLYSQHLMLILSTDEWGHCDYEPYDADEETEAQTG